MPTSPAEETRQPRSRGRSKRCWDFERHQELDQPTAAKQTNEKFNAKEFINNIQYVNLGSSRSSTGTKALTSNPDVLSLCKMRSAAT